jgi:DNA repair exonuclease SbcCD ATPase subunit
MMTWIELSDQYFQWWQDAAGRYVDWIKEQPVVLKAWGGFLDQSLQMKKITDQVIDELWRAVRLTSREDVIRLHERLNLLESHLVELKERDWAEGVIQRIEGKVVAPDDLEGLRNMLDRIERQMAEAAAVQRVREAIANLESKLAELSGDLGEIKKIVHRSSSNLDDQPATSTEPTRTAPDGTSDATA